jgi:hypothetical protein
MLNIDDFSVGKLVHDGCMTYGRVRTNSNLEKIYTIEDILYDGDDLNKVPIADDFYENLGE